MAQIVVYTKSYCPYSKDCKAWFKEKGLEYHEKVTDQDEALANEMKTKSGGRTDTPQIFINSHHLGSFDDLKALKSTGKLDEMLNL